MASNIFGYFAENWHDDGDSTANAFRWYINGHTKVRGGVVGGYYDGGKSYLKNLSAPSGFYKNSYFSNSEIKVVTAKNLQSVLCQSVKSDNATMLAIMPTNGGGGHAVTFWGYEKTSSGFKIYITDSDDGEKGMKSYMLTKKTNYGGYEFWVIDNYVSGTEYVVAAIQSMSLLGVNQKGKLYRLKKIAATAGVLPLGAAGALETEPDSPEINVCETLEVEPDARIDIDIDFLDYSDLYFADNIVKVKNWDESSKLWVNFSFEDDDGDFLDALMSEGASVDFLAYTDGCDLALSDFSLFNADINGFFSEKFEDGNNIVSFTFAAIPEPSEIAAILGAVVLCSAFVRRAR